MKLLISGDWHIRQTAPERRLDDYWVTVMKKVGFIIDLANEEGCNFIIQPGDFFDSHKANDFLKRYMIKKLQWKKMKVLTVFGQHDLRYHSSDVRNTPLGVLYAAKVVYVAPHWEPLEFSGIHIWGASWYEDIPKKVKDKDAFNILIIVFYK